MRDDPEALPPACEESKEIPGDYGNEFLVDWAGLDDPQHPQNFNPVLKWFITAIYGCMAMLVTFSSSVFSAANAITAQEFNVSPFVMSLATALTVLVRT